MNILRISFFHLELAHSSPGQPILSHQILTKSFGSYFPWEEIGILTRASSCSPLSQASPNMITMLSSYHDNYRCHYPDEDELGYLDRCIREVWAIRGETQSCNCSSILRHTEIYTQYLHFHSYRILELLDVWSASWPYLIFVTGTTGGACVNFFCQV